MKFSRPIFLPVLFVYVATGVASFLMLKERTIGTIIIPKFIHGSLPNFVPTAYAPIILLISKKKYTYQEYAKFVMYMLLAMCFYEFLQIWMPRRTFDWFDILASMSGALVALFIGWIVPFPFFGSLKPPSLRP
jgi:hypothetical protein